MRVIGLILFFLLNTYFFVNAQAPKFNYPNQFNMQIVRPQTTAFGLQDQGKIIPHTYFLKTADAQKIKETVRSLYPEVLIAVDDRTRAVIVNCTASKWQEINTVIQKLDAAIPQIKLSVQIMEVNSSELNQYKHIFSNIADGFQVNYNFANNSLSASDIRQTFSFLIQNGFAKVLARPSVSGLDNQKASIKVGERIPYISSIMDKENKTTQVNYLDTGIELEILPQIASGNMITVDISASISNVKIWKDYKDVTFPILSSRKTQTKVHLQDNQTLIMAGLLDDENRITKTKVPILSDIPWIGDFFKGQHEEKIQSDIVFLITPQIL